MFFGLEVWWKIVIELGSVNNKIMDPEIKGEFKKVRVEFKEEFKKVRGEFKEEFKKVNSDISELKADVKELKNNSKNYVTKDHLNMVVSKLVTKVEFDEFKTFVYENMFTKQDYMDHMSMIEEMVQEVRDSRRDRLIFEGQFVDVDDKVNDHEKRIRTLEKAA